VRATTASCSAHMVLSVRGCALPSDRSSTQPDSGPHRTGVTCVFNYPSDPHVRAPRVYRIRTTMEPSAMLSSNDEYRYDKHLISSCQNSVNAQWYKATRGAARRYSHRVQSSNSVRSESGAYSYYQRKLVTSSAGKS